MSSKKDPNRYDEVDNKFVKDINEIEDSICDQRVAGGKRVDKYINDKGGIIYGDRTIESIAQHPDIQVCSETLRRWWACHLIYRRMGSEIIKRYPKARARDYYAFARVLRASILTRDGESQEAAQRRVILEIVDWLAQRRNHGKVTCAEVDAMVTKVIDAGAADNVIKKNDHTDKKPDRRSKVAKAISFTNIQDAVDFLENFSAPGHLATASVNRTELGNNANRALKYLSRIADHLMATGFVEPVRDLIETMRQQADELEAKLGPASVTWTVNSDTSVKMEVP